MMGLNKNLRQPVAKKPIMQKLGQQRKADTAGHEAHLQKERHSSEQNKKKVQCKCSYVFFADATNFSKIVCPWCGKAFEK